ncbi:MAG: autotransporter outer membrane beta-barrel domain-containing protein, partial [Puniceicoccales bacterium]|nr:autotransporter outer membrane beta-barrel domain-containing protein [Puniceicoccales bacterium]
KILSSAEIEAGYAGIFVGGTDASQFSNVFVNDGATIASDMVNILGKNVRITISGQPCFTGTSTHAIAPGEIEFEYGKGMLFVRGLGIHDPCIKVRAHTRNKTPLKLELKLENDAVLAVTEKDIVASTLQMGANSQISCRRMVLFDDSNITQGTIAASDGIFFAPPNDDISHTLHIDNAGKILKNVSRIDASIADFRPKNEDTNKICLSTNMGNSNEILPGGIIGNFKARAYDGSEDQGIEVILGGYGGTIGTEMEPITMDEEENLDLEFPENANVAPIGEQGIVNVGKLVIDCENFHQWTILGDISCKELHIKSGNLLQRKGLLSVWGNMLLLGCDLQWDNAVFYSGIYGSEDRIVARAGSQSLFRNGFTCDDYNAYGEAIDLDGASLKTESILLGGNAQFVVDREATAVIFQIAGVNSDHFQTSDKPVAIRVVGSTLQLDGPASEMKDGQVMGRYNVIDLGRALNINYYNADGQFYNNKDVTAIRGNCTTDLYLRGVGDAYGNCSATIFAMHTETIAGNCNETVGIVSNVGRIFVDGSWGFSGLHQCGELHIGPSGYFSVKNGTLDLEKLCIYLDATRNESYLHCGNIPEGLVCEIYCDASQLASIDDGTEFLLIDGLSDDQGNLHLLQNYFTAEYNGAEGIYLKFTGKGSLKLDEFNIYSSNAMGLAMEKMRLRGLPPVDNIRTLLPAQTRVVRRTHEYIRRNLCNASIYESFYLKDNKCGSDDVYECDECSPNILRLKSDYRCHLVRGTYFSFLSEPHRNALYSSITAEMGGLGVGLQKFFPFNVNFVAMVNYARSMEKFHGNSGVSYNRAIHGYGVSFSAKYEIADLQLQMMGVANGERYRHSGNYGAMIPKNSSLYAKLNGYSYSLAAAADYTFHLGKLHIGPSLRVDFDSIHQHVHDGDNLDSDCAGESFNVEALQGSVGLHSNINLKKLYFSSRIALCHDVPCG